MEEKVFTSTREVLEHYMPSYAAKGECADKNNPVGPSVEGKGKEFAEEIFSGMKKDLKQPATAERKTLGRKLTRVLGSLFNSN